MTLWRYSSGMALAKRATIYLEPDVHRALRLKAVEADRSVSDLVNDAVRRSLHEDADDLKSFRDRAREPTLPFEQLLKDLRKRGKL
jgi:hypothetical protein